MSPVPLDMETSDRTDNDHESDLRIFLHHISRDLEAEDVEALKFVSGVKGCKAEEIKTGLQLMMELNRSVILNWESLYRFSRKYASALPPVTYAKILDKGMSGQVIQVYTTNL